MNISKTARLFLTLLLACQVLGLLSLQTSSASAKQLNAQPLAPPCGAANSQAKRGLQFGNPVNGGATLLTPEVAGKLKCSGAGWVRLNFLCYGDGMVGQYKPIVASLNPMTVIGLISYDSVCLDRTNRNQNSTGSGDNPYVQAFAGKAAAIANAFPEIRYWEIWNEPNDNTGVAFNYLAPSVFAQLLAQTSIAIKQSQPGAIIVSGAVTTGVANTSTYLTQTLQKGLDNHLWDRNGTRDGRVIIDGIGFHHYASGLSTWLARIDSIVKNKIGHRQVYITEIGTTRSGIYQAQWLRSAYQVTDNNPNVQASIWFYLQDQSPTNPGYFGLLNTSGDPKPAWCQFAFNRAPDTRCQAVSPPPCKGLACPVGGNNGNAGSATTARSKNTIWQIASHSTFGTNMVPRNSIDEAPVGSTLVLNIGSKERRMARGIQVNETNETFVVTQLSASLPGDFSVTAFGVTQVYTGITNILADGDDGNDVITVQSTAPAEIYGGDGDDQIQSGDGNDILSGDAGNNVVNGGGGSDIIDGGDGADVLNGEGGDDALIGEGGNDSLDGGSGSDILSGNEGNDSLVGGDGSDALYGDAGDDTLYGGAGEDYLEGSDGADNMNGGDGSDGMYGNDGPDQMYGDGDRDTMYGNAGDDAMSGGAGDDYMEGNEDSDTMSGDEGPDDMIGGTPATGASDGRDTMHGGDGVDVMAGDNARITRTVDGSGRQITLFDVAAVGGPAVSPGASGSDLMFGDAGNDRMFGQGNGAVGDTVGMDPPDGIDNDRNGRENGSSTGMFDCLDGRDNDGDGKIDPTDPQCAAAIDNSPGGDEMHGGAGDDYMEGNHGSDWMFGDGGEDDMLGGSSAGDGVIGGPVSPAGLRDGSDVMNGNGEDDVMLADNGQIIRPVDANGLNKRLTGGAFDLAIRNTRMAQTPEATGAYGNDWISAGDGVDDIYGQLGNDYMEGNEGEDALVGDLGKITNNLIGLNDGIPDPGSEQRIAPNAPFFDPGELIYQKGSLYRQVELYAYVSAGGGGNDTMYGGGGSDAIHGGAGDDILNGNAGDDHIFGGDDSDAMWGGPGHDTMFGGYGIDYLDVLPRPARADRKDSFPEDPPTWFEAARIDNYQGLDIMYGGWDRDWMQADVSAPGRTNGDRMIDWAGAFNAYYRCDAAYGDWVITRQHSPSLVAFLQALAQGYGALNTARPGTPGFRETAIVFPREVKDNANPPNPDNPAHFTCGPSR